MVRAAHKQLKLKSLGQALDTALVICNWLFGWYIVEFEQGGADRAELYGKRLIERIAEELTARLGRGFSKRSLEQYRRFYDCYSCYCATW